METSSSEALLKIRHQIQVAELYQTNNPDWITPVEILRELRERERILANKVQVEIFKAELHRMCKLFIDMQHGE
jgi:hypothetical protein